MTARVSPTERLRAEIDELFAREGDLGKVLEEVTQVSVRLLLQAALEAEVTEFLGRQRFARGGRQADTEGSLQPSTGRPGPVGEAELAESLLGLLGPLGVQPSKRLRLELHAELQATLGHEPLQHPRVEGRPLLVRDFTRPAESRDLLPGEDAIWERVPQAGRMTRIPANRPLPRIQRQASRCLR